MNFSQFQDPWLLLFLLGLPLLALQKRQGATVHFSSIVALKTLRPSRVDLYAGLPLVLRFLALALLIIALARPQEGHKSTEILSIGVDIILALDTSGSMRALDFIEDEKRITRLAVVKGVVSKFIDYRPNDRIGMVVFGEQAYTQCPLTSDQDILQSFLNKLEIGMAGDSTAIGSAIGISSKTTQGSGIKIHSHHSVDRWQEQCRVPAPSSGRPDSQNLRNIYLHHCSGHHRRGTFIGQLYFWPTLRLSASGYR